MQHTLVCRKEWCSSGWGTRRGSSWGLGKVLCAHSQPRAAVWAGQGTAVLVPCHHPHVGLLLCSPTESSALSKASSGLGSVTRTWDLGSCPGKQGKVFATGGTTGTRNPGRISLANCSSQEKGANAKIHKAPRGSRREIQKVRIGHLWRAAPPLGTADCTAQTPRAPGTEDLLKTSLVPSHLLNTPQNCTAVCSLAAQSSAWVPAPLGSSQVPQRAEKAQGLGREGQEHKWCCSCSSLQLSEPPLVPHLTHKINTSTIFTSELFKLHVQLS